MSKLIELHCLNKDTITVALDQIVRVTPAPQNNSYVLIKGRETPLAVTISYEDLKRILTENGLYV